LLCAVRNVHATLYSSEISINASIFLY
jgi:hypothetical protein